MNVPDELEVEVFRAGDYGPRGNYTEADLARMAKDYDPALHEAPVTFDHEERGPAHGWVAGLRAAGDTLLARIKDLSEPLREALSKKAYKKRSLEIYRRFGETEGPYVRALAFLGAAVPQVKGMQDPSFSEDAGGEVVCFEEEQGSEQHVAEVPELLANEPDPAEEMRDYLMRRGTWRPEWQEAGMMELFRAIQGEEHRRVLLEALEGGGQPVAFGEVPQADGENAVPFSEELVGVAAPASQSLHRRAMAILKAEPGLAYSEALARSW